MSTKKIRVPEGMRAAGYVAAVENRGRVFIEPSVLHVMNDAILEAALRWLDDILNEADTDFHRAILKRGAERYGDGPAHGIQRVAFEFGCSFARQHIRSLFSVPEPQIPEAIKDLIGKMEPPFPAGEYQWMPIEQMNSRIIEAYRRGRESREP